MSSLATLTKKNSKNLDNLDHPIFVKTMQWSCASPVWVIKETIEDFDRKIVVQCTLVLKVSPSTRIVR